MSCTKYNLTNTGNTIVTFNYQKCDSAEWEYQVELGPGQIKNIWFVDTTFSAPLNSGIVIMDEGVFPPTPTPSRTPQPTVTPTNTPTPTPTNSVRYIFTNVPHSETDPAVACASGGTATLFGNAPTFSSSTLFWSSSVGNTGDAVGYYAVSGIVYQLSSCNGVTGCLSGSTKLGSNPC